MTVQPAAPVLDQRAWSAVAVALQDAQRCGCATAPVRPGRVRRLLDVLLGHSRRPAGLADPRLEAVRRLTCHSRRFRSAEPALADHGFSSAQIDALAILSA